MSNRSNRLQLTSEFAKKVNALFNAAHQKVHELAKFLYDIHEQYIILDRNSRSGMKRVGAYDSDFNKWWEQNRLDLTIGSRSNFSRWARAGEAISRVSKTSGDPNQLPRTVDALFVVNQMTDEQISRGLKQKRDPKDPHFIISPFSTAASLRNWLQQSTHRKKNRRKKFKNTLFASIQLPVPARELTETQLKQLTELQKEISALVSNYENTCTVEFNEKALDSRHKSLRNKNA